ncbi:LacI family DNA-binding transcriptional regulator [Geminisphaera colitermitum]|uniref:substrate-binding domain-containing protein n=1 Tax=Geminisphaera colitermitum TaxID=1148786 RepID=UPI0001964F6B|nr:LacI family DNA-binding transcriptional regulator [Geminisphaera colitermitum]
MIAVRAGVHFSTVSLALNNHPSIPLATRERLQSLAEEMGYRPDPVLASLVAYRQQQKKKRDHGVLAWIDNWPAATGMAHERARHIYPALWEGASARAGLRGWKLEEFCPSRQGMTAAAFCRMLRTRGIDGLLVAPMPGAGGELEMEWEAFSAIAIGNTMTSPHLHRVMPHHVHNMQAIMRELGALGYRRPAFVLDQTINERTRHYWTAAFLDAQLRLPKARRLEPLLLPFDAAATGRGVLMEWIRRVSPDVLIASRADEVVAWLRGTGLRVPEDVGVASAAFLTETWKPGQCSPTDTAGIDERFDSIGATAIDTLVGLIHRHERGVPEEAMHILIEGRWHPGRSVAGAGV